MGVLQDVRDSCAWVCQRAQDVRINSDSIEAYAAALAQVEPVTELDPVYHFAGGEEETTAFVLILDSVNFGSGWFPVLDKTGASSGYYKVALSLKRWFEQEGVPSADRLLQLRVADCSEIFGQVGNPAVADLMELFAQSLNGLGRSVRASGSYTDFVLDAGGSTERLITKLCVSPLFSDTADYDGRIISFYKRAQITVSDLHLALHGQGAGSFTEIDDLTCFADNLVPHVLRVDGVLEYSKSLAATIESGQLVVPGSPQEVEIRAAAVHVVELLVAALRAQGVTRPARVVDNILWERGQGERFKSSPRHRTRTAFY